MDFEFRELLRRYTADPTWELGYRLLRLNEKMTGEPISKRTLYLFGVNHLFRPFFRAIEKLHDSAMAGAAADEWDLYENLQYSIILQDNVAAHHRGFIPSPADHPFHLMYTLILKEDVIFPHGGFSGSPATSIAFNRTVDGGLSGTLNSNTFDELRHHMRRAFGYSIDYIWDNTWGFQSVLPIPQGNWDEVTRTMNHDLLLIYTFYPDEVLWHELISREFRL